MIGKSELDCQACNIVFFNQPDLFLHLANEHKALAGILPEKTSSKNVLLGSKSSSDEDNRYHTHNNSFTL
jgi:hypothetical protein